MDHIKDEFKVLLVQSHIYFIEVVVTIQYIKQLLPTVLNIYIYKITYFVNIWIALSIVGLILKLSFCENILAN